MPIARSNLDQLIYCLEACQSFQSSHNRAAVAHRLPAEIRARVPDANSLRAAATALIETCAQYANGLQALRHALNFVEGDTIAMTVFDEHLATIAALGQEIAFVPRHRRDEVLSAPRRAEMLVPEPVKHGADRASRRHRVFYSYCHADEARRDRLDVHLKLLHRQNIIESWHDRRIAPGSDWANEIDQRLEVADLILLLVSADFLASEYCWSVETKRALDRHQSGSARVVPIILRSCDWRDALFGRLQALPRDGKPISSWNDEDDAWAEVAIALRRLLDEVEPPVAAAQEPAGHGRSRPYRR